MEIIKFFSKIQKKIQNLFKTHACKFGYFINILFALCSIFFIYKIVDIIYLKQEQMISYCKCFQKIKNKKISFKLNKIHLTFFEKSPQKQIFILNKMQKMNLEILHYKTDSHKIIIVFRVKCNQAQNNKNKKNYFFIY